MTTHSNSPQAGLPASENQGGAGTELVVDIGPIAHGGHFVTRHEGRVIFVRHAIPGEKARIRLTDSGDSSRFWRADVVEVLEASPDRVPHFWKPADSLAAWGRGGPPVGGAELGHISLQRQRALKGEVLTEQLKRLAGLDLTTEVEAVGDNHDGGLGWRTRAGFAVTTKGRLGMHAHRSDVVLPIKEMPLALPGVNGLKLWDLDLSGIARVEVAVPANGSRPLILLAPEESTSPKRLHSILSQLPHDVSVASFDPSKGEVLQLRGRTWVQESAAGHEYRVTGEGFWQIHKDAPDTLVGAVTDYLSGGGYLQPGAAVADLYAGAGLFTAPLADAVGVTGSVLSVEGAPGTSRDARKNLHGQPQVEIVQGRVERVLHQRARSFDSVVLDPPRAGAGKAVVKQLMATGPRAIAYVSCDPASFARDLGYFHQGGWRLESLRAFDLYPNTHHLETVGLIVPSA
ncbi:class I SAM-dependent RNA methyltransferase [Paenarthrobacter aurescens]|uniref:class I SAM-dependent RNA methyltransferase n=1 Tax=Paenarthrobacter aurescens TaxID=43663 RepID=UPI0021BE0381|nr:class I SAM-dependent RNA methyltransferase [Paenarthrobacter aurescens]MCT9871810.1 class I SAM-dependent RNA methyltransferase [Paenarthrobacter aurescens]